MATLTAALCLAGATDALADTRYAAPGGTGPVADCFEANPCSLPGAVDSTQAEDGDVVLLKPGTYTLGGTLGTVDELTIQPEQPGTRPVIEISGFTALINNPGDPLTVRDLRVRASGLGGATPAINILGGLLERVEVEANGVGAFGVVARGGLVVRDTTVRAPSVNGVGLITATTGAEIRNVTAHGGDVGLSIDGNFTAGGGTQTTVVRNTIAIGPTRDIGIDEPAGVTVNATITHSNYDPATVFGSPTVFESDNRTAEPLLANVPAGDFHQLAGSNSINAGTTSTPPVAGALDLDREPRNQGSAPDVGADEFDEIAPGVTITAGPPHLATIATTSTAFEFSTDDASAALTCRVDGAGFGPCTGPGNRHELVDLAEGSHEFAVRATDPNGNATTATRAFAVDLAGPAPPGPDTDPPTAEITKGPPDRTQKEKAKFKFVADEPASTFECRLDKKPFKPCASPRRYKRLDEAKHRFFVRATDPAGNTGPADKDAWKVLD